MLGHPRFLPRAFWLGAGLACLACADGTRVVADGWHEGSAAPSTRAFADSIVGISGGMPTVRYVGLQNPAELAVNPNGRAGARFGDAWAQEMLRQVEPSVVVGFPGSAVTNAAARHFAAAGIPVIAPNATARSVPEVEAYVFRLLPSEDVQARTIVDFLADSADATRIAVVFAGDAYGVGILRGVRGATAARRLQLADEVELPEGSCRDEASSAARLATRAMLRRATPSAVVLALPLTTATCVMTEIWAADPRIWIIASDALDEWVVDRWVERVAPVRRLRIVTGWSPRSDSATTAFISRIAARRGRSPQGADALHYDALALAALAVRETDGRPESVRRWLQQLGSERPAYRGLTGDISFAPDAAPRLALREVAP